MSVSEQRTAAKEKLRVAAMHIDEIVREYTEAAAERDKLRASNAELVKTSKVASDAMMRGETAFSAEAWGDIVQQLDHDIAKAESESGR